MRTRRVDDPVNTGVSGYSFCVRRVTPEKTGGMNFDVRKGVVGITVVGGGTPLKEES